MSSTLYTIGTALSRAQGTEQTVEILVGGQWLTGVPRDVDGHGVVLEMDDRSAMVVRVEAVMAVRTLPHRLSVVEDAGAREVARSVLER